MNTRMLFNISENMLVEKQITSILIVVTRMEFIVFDVITLSSDTLMLSSSVRLYLLCKEPFQRLIPSREHDKVLDYNFLSRSVECGGASR